MIKSFRRHKFTKIFAIADSRDHFLKKCRRCGVRKIGRGANARCYGKPLTEERAQLRPMRSEAQA